jgi:hypothetical protein
LPSGERRDEYILGSLIAITVAAMSGVAVGIIVGLGAKVAVIASGVGFAACNVAVNAGTDGSGIAGERHPLISQMNTRTKRSGFRFIGLPLNGKYPLTHITQLCGISGCIIPMNIILHTGNVVFVNRIAGSIGKDALVRSANGCGCSLWRCGSA